MRRYARLDLGNNCMLHAYTWVRLEVQMVVSGEGAFVTMPAYATITNGRTVQSNTVFSSMSGWGDFRHAPLVAIQDGILKAEATSWCHTSWWREFG